MGNRNTSIDGISDETKELLVQQTGRSFRSKDMIEEDSISI